MTHRTAIIVLVGISFLTGSLGGGCDASSKQEALAAQAAADKAAEELEAKRASKATAAKEPATKAPVAKAAAPETDCKALQKELMTYSNVHGKVIGFAWGQALGKAKLSQKKMMAVFQSAQALQQELSKDPALTRELGEHGVAVLIQAGCGPAGSPAPATGEQRCKLVDENLATFRKLMNDVLDKGFKKALRQNKLGKRIPKLIKLFEKHLPKAKQKYKAEVDKVRTDLLQRTGCQAS